ncbi:MAG: nitronate monooxygenase [Deltaproteobacteria bacterium]|nr:nitronate monooxygenase [Deltaproteobacteria bacterium]
MSSALHTEICDRLGIRYPIIQTGMGWVATPELVAGASNAGAIGFLAAATIPPPQVEDAILAVKQLTDQPFGVNFLMDAPGADVISDAIVRQGVKAAGYNRAPNADLINKLKDAGVVCVPTCGAVKHVQKAEQLGADIVIVQGGEGGGHTGPVPTSILLPAAAAAVDVPVVGAGGFKDGRGLVAALAFGAAGIAMGTRFVLTRESPVPRASIDRFLAAEVADVVLTTQIDGMPQRVVMNELVKRLESASGPARLLLALRNGLSFRKTTGASLSELLTSALKMRRNQRLSNAQTIMAANAPMLAKKGMAEGDPVRGYLPGGSIAGVIDDLPSCQELVQRIMSEAEETLKALAK